MSTYFSDKFYIVQRSQPVSVVNADSLARNRFSVLVPRRIYALVALVLPFVIEIQELIEESLKCRAVVVDGFHSHHLAHILSAGRVSYHPCTAADKNYRRMAVLLHVHQNNDLHKVSDMQTVGSRVKTDIKLDFFFSKQFSDRFLVGYLFDKASFFQHIVDIIKITYVVRNKVFHKSILFLLNLP